MTPWFHPREAVEKALLEFFEGRRLHPPKH
jgi:hypothetical protein